MPAETIVGAVPTNAEDAHGCRLTDRFAIAIQLLLASIALSSLLYKRHRESPRRPILVWVCDVSKQACGGFLVHALNLLFSILPELGTPDDLGLSNKESDPSGACVLYFLNVLLDTTIGVLILALWLRLAARIVVVLFSQDAGSRDDFLSGYYGSPPRFLPWLKQTLVFSACLFLMKVCVVLMIRAVPYLSILGGAILALFATARLQAVFVMLLFPLCMSVLQFWVVDQLLKNKQPRYIQEAGDDPDSENHVKSEAGTVTAAEVYGTRYAVLQTRQSDKLGERSSSRSSHHSRSASNEESRISRYATASPVPTFTSSQATSSASSPSGTSKNRSRSPYNQL